jgi:hypothetical protein
VYRERIVDARIEQLLARLPVVAIDGAPGVGKTATAIRHSAATISPDLIGTVALRARPALVDDWDRSADAWDRIDGALRAGAPAGSFVVTGRAAPVGAGVACIRMRPRSLAERRPGRQTVAVADLLSGSRPEIGGDTDVALAGYVHEIVSSGLPGVRPDPGRPRSVRLDDYLDRLVRQDVGDAGLAVRRRSTLRRWLTAYAAATGTTMSQNAVLRAAAPEGTPPPAKTTALAYRSVLDRLGVLDPVPAWQPPADLGLGKIGRGPKHHLVDPALAARLLGLDAAALLHAGPATTRGDGLLEALFESLVTLSVRTYADAAQAATRHYRTRDGRHRADLLLVRPDGRAVAAEITAAAEPPPASVDHLGWLRDRVGGDRLLDAVVITTGARAYRRADGIAVVPAVLLGP